MPLINVICQCGKFFPNGDDRAKHEYNMMLQETQELDKIGERHLWVNRHALVKGTYVRPQPKEHTQCQSAYASQRQC